MNKRGFGLRIALLALGWALAVARGVTVGLDAGTRWSAVGLLAVTVSLGLVRSIPDDPSETDPPALEDRSWRERVFASAPGKVVVFLAAAILAVGTGSIVGTLVCVPVVGIAETIAVLPDILGMAALGATLSAVGFVVLTVVSAMLGPILSSVFEAWIAYVAPVIGGVAGAVLEYGVALEGPVGDILESGPIARGILVIGLSAVVGGLVSPISLAIAGKGKDRLKHVDQEVTAGLGFGAINGIVLALLLWAVGMLR